MFSVLLREGPPRQRAGPVVLCVQETEAVSACRCRGSSLRRAVRRRRPRARRRTRCAALTKLPAIVGLPVTAVRGIPTTNYLQTDTFRFAAFRLGAVAEWLGRGLQSLVQRFESARRLTVFRRFTVSSSLTGFSPVLAESLDRGLGARPRGVQIDLGDARGRVPEQLLDGVEIALGRVEHVGRERVPHHVRLAMTDAGSGLDPRPPGVEAAIDERSRSGFSAMIRSPIL